MPTSEWDLEPDGPKERLRRLAGIIPGYKGYLDREASRDADRLLRGRVAIRLGEAIDRLVSLCEQLSRSLKLSRIVDVDRAAAEIRRVQARCEHADYGYSGIFHAAQVDLRMLESLGEHDLGLVAASEAVVARATEAAAVSDDDIGAALEAVLAATRAVDAKISERESVLSGTSKPEPGTEESGS